MVYHGRVRNGRIELDPDVRLPEGAAIEIIVADQQTPSNDENIPTLYEQLKDIIGSVPGLPEDLSINHDHYLYGVQKRT